MPIYEYQCSACNAKFEFLQKLNDAPLKDCPACNSSSLKKLISATGFKLKGTGWYVTDFKDKGKETKANENQNKNSKEKQKNISENKAKLNKKNSKTKKNK